MATFTQTVPLAGRGTGASQSRKSPSLSCKRNEACSGCFPRSSASSSALVPVELKRKHGALSDHGAALSLTTRYLTFLVPMTRNCSSSQEHAGSCRLTHYHTVSQELHTQKDNDAEAGLRRLLQVGARLQPTKRPAS